jgi:hypothetical protein
MSINILNDKNLIDGNNLIELLDDIISTRLLNLGLVKKDKYLWYSPNAKGIKQGFKYSLLKGGQGTFKWGICVDFIPILSGNALKFFKSENKFWFHLFEWTDEYSNSFFGGQMTNGVTSHWGFKTAKKTITQVFNNYELKIQAWFDKALEFDGIIDIAESQSNFGKQYNIHSPNPKYVLAFLYAKTMRIERSIPTFDELSLTTFNNNEGLRLKAKTNLLTLIEAKTER